MRKLKTLLALCAVLSMGIINIPVSALELNTPDTGIISQGEEKPTSGTCGEDVNWNFDESTGTLTISGTGRTNNICPSPWKDFSIHEVVIEEGLTEIGDMAFDGCTGLTFVTIPDSVTEIGALAFSNCTNLTSVTIPESVTTIEGGAFADCNSLTSITIPENVTNIGAEAFLDTPWLDAQLEESPFVVVNSIIIASNSNTCEGDIIIPEGVTSIGSKAFYDCEGLTSVTIPNSVTSIGYQVFYGCSNLISITIPDSVTIIGDYVFANCDSLTSVTIPNSVANIEWIGWGVFSCCSSLTSITIPDNVTNIGPYAFMGCANLTSVTIPDSVTEIGMGAFIDCEKLESITIKNPNCNIFYNYYDNNIFYNYYDNNSPGTISNGEDDNGDYYNGTIYGYAGSTAQAYAEKYGYKFEALDGEPTKPDPVQGDADGDGALAVTDVVAIQKAILGGETLSNWESCDFYPDGVINVFDLILMKKALLAK